MKDIATYAGVSESSVYRWRHNGELPEPIDPSAKRFEWEPRVIRAWVKRHFRAQQPDPDVADTWWDAQDIAEYLGVAPVSVQRYWSRRELPEPDDYFGRFPVWAPQVIIEWDKRRPGYAHKARSVVAGRRSGGAKPAAEKAIRSEALKPGEGVRMPVEAADVVWWGYAHFSKHTGKSVDALRHMRSKMPAPGRFHGRSPVWPREELLAWWRTQQSASASAGDAGRPEASDQATSQ